MRLATRLDSEDVPLSDEQLAVMQRRARLKLPIARSHDSHELFHDEDNYNHFKAIHKMLGRYLALCRKSTEEDAEVTFNEIADVVGAEPKKPRKFMHRLPLPCTNPRTKTAKFVWKWAEVKDRVRQLAVINLIREISAKF